MLQENVVNASEGSVRVIVKPNEGWFRVGFKLSLGIFLAQTVVSASLYAIALLSSAVLNLF